MWVWRLLRALLLGGMLSAALCARADNVAVILSEDSAVYHEIVDIMRHALETPTSNIKVWPILAQTAATRDAEILRTDFYSLVVTVGARAAAAMVASGIRAPVLATLVPKATFDKLQQQHESPTNWSALYLDQPLTRQLNLVRVALPGKTKLGVLYGPTSIAWASDLERAAHPRGLTIESEQVANEDDIGPALRKLLARAESLFALPDPEVFNKSTVQQILLATYRSNDPVVAFSAAYVKAGALAALYSSPQQIARQTAELVLAAKQEQRYQLPAPQYPRLWTIEVNRNVAHSLGIELPDDADLAEQIARTPEDQP